MKYSCAVADCLNTYALKKKKDITFHTFPNSDTERRKLWISVCKRPDGYDFRSAIMCCEHFESSAYQKNSKRKLLKPDAVPTIFENRSSRLGFILREYRVQQLRLQTRRKLAQEEREQSKREKKTGEADQVKRPLLSLRSLEIKKSSDMEVEEDTNTNDESSSAFPDIQTDPNDSLPLDGDEDGEETETEEMQEEKQDEGKETSNKNSSENEQPTGADNEVSMDLSDLETGPEKPEHQDEDTLISQDENELLEDKDEQNYSTEESEPVLLDNINENASSSSTPAASSSKFRSSSRNGVVEDVSEKPLLSSLLNNRTESSNDNKSSSPPPQQNCNFSISDGNAIAKELDEQVTKLNQLLVLKEKEWSAILRLKKHVEYALDQVKCTQRMAKAQEGLNGAMSTTDIKACMSLIASDKETFNFAERQMEESIESAETENESLQIIFPFRSNSQVQVTKETSGNAPGKGEPFTATAALQKLCERKRKAMDDISPGKNSRLRMADASQIQSKVIGNGRKGAIVDVQSIIQSHRNLTGDKGNEKQGGRNTKASSYASSSVINMQPDRQYLKTLEELVAMAEAERQKETTVSLAVPPPTVTQLSRSLTPKPKNGKPLRQSGSNSLLSNPSSSGSGTLAKMLSPSTHSSIGSNRNSNDVTTTSQKFSTKLPTTTDANLSLANLLATSKVETKVNLSKVKKERNVREDDNSHVPSQQEAVPICQGCNLSRAQFVCAGCANQWYCSRECQVAAWDEHSEICSG